MSQFLPVILVAVAYLIGSIPFSFLIVRLVAGDDIREHGSGNVGATNVLRNFGKKAGAIALVFDIAKGFAAAVLAQQVVTHPSWPYRFTAGSSFLYAPSFWIALCCVVAVLAHMYPLWLHFQGGKGVATAAGVFAALDARALLAGVIVFLIVLIVTRYVSLASMVSAAAIPIFIRYTSDAPMWITVGVIVIAVAVIAKHHSNIARLAQGSERKFPR